MDAGIMGEDVVRRPKAQAPLLSVQGSYARLEGKFEIADSVLVQCEIGGEMDVDGELVIGKEGAVRAEVRSVDAVIEGIFEGDLVASGKVEIRSTGRVTGNLRTNSLVIEPGGFFNGNVKQLEETPVAPAVEKPRETVAVKPAEPARNGSSAASENGDSKGEDGDAVKSESTSYAGGSRPQARKVTAA